MYLVESLVIIVHMHQIDAEMGGKCRILQLNKSTKNTTFFNLFYYRVLGYLFTIQTKKLFFRLLFCTLVHMVYIASPTLHRSKRSGLVKCHSRRRVCIVCGGKWVEWDVTSGGYEKITRAEYWQITAEWGLRGSRTSRVWWGLRFVTLAGLVSQSATLL